MNTPALELVSLTKDYWRGFWRKGPFRALDALSFSIEPGEIFGLLGPNGAGKSTTLKILLRLVYPSAGSARLLGQPLEDVDVHRRLGYLPEAPYFYDYLTGREFLRYCGELAGLDAAAARARAGEWLERLDLERAADIPLRRYSRGMLQRVGLAQALLHDPELIFLDEPMLGLDPVGRRELREIILELRARGKTVCFSTHILSDAESLCGRVAILNRGRLHGLGRLDDILRLEVEASEVLIGRPSPALQQALASIADGSEVCGDRLTLRVQDARLFAALDAVRQHGGRLLAVNPVRVSLEDYFFQQFGTERQPELSDSRTR